MMNDEIKEILARPTCSVAEFGRVVGLSKNPAYNAVHRGDVPSLRFGGRIRVVTAPLKASLELDRLVPNTSAA
jgi:hypothetical protein